MTAHDRRDHVLRAITDDGAFRVVTIQTTDTVQGAIHAQGIDGPAARVFADLLTGAVLVRETMSPDLRVQAILQATDSKSRMVADTHPDGMTRGLWLPREGADRASFALGSDARLQVARTLHNGAPHQGVVEVPEQRGISGALMNYMQSSEQVFSVIAVGARFAAGEVIGAAGYIVQLLPEVGEGPLMVMTERLDDFQRIDKLLEQGGAEPRALLGELLYGMPYTEVGETTVHFGCNCSRERILSSLSTLPRHEVQELFDRGEVLEIACDYCKKEYQIGAEQLRGLLGSN